MFPLAAFLTQIVILVNQQDDYDDGHGVGGHFRAKEEEKKSKQTAVVSEITHFAVQIPSSQILKGEGTTLQKQAGE